MLLDCVAIIHSALEIISVKWLLLETHLSSWLILNEDLWASKNSFAINQKSVYKCVCVRACAPVVRFPVSDKSHYLKLKTCEVDL